MRVTSNTYSAQLLNQLDSLNARTNRLQMQTATGQKLRAPDDDPAAMQRVLDLQSEGASIDQFRKNISALNNRGTASFEVMRGMKKIMDRVLELSTLAQDGTKSAEDMKIYGAEVSQLIRQSAQLVNGKYNGEYLFGGTKTNQTPFVTTLDAQGYVASVSYQGNTDVPEAEIAEGMLVSVQVPGVNSSGTGARGLVADSRVGADLFGHLVAFQNHLLSGDRTAIKNADHANLAIDSENMVFQMGTNGATQSRLEAAEAIASNRSDSIAGLISTEADADLAQTLVQLNQTQTAYQAALQSGSNIMRLSLLDYIR